MTITAEYWQNCSSMQKAFVLTNYQLKQLFLFCWFCGFNDDGNDENVDSDNDINRCYWSLIRMYIFAKNTAYIKLEHNTAVWNAQLQFIERLKNRKILLI